jgi:hypothetical protein
MHFFYLGWVQCSNPSHLQGSRYEKREGGVDSDNNLHRFKSYVTRFYIHFHGLYLLTCVVTFVIISLISSSSYLFIVELITFGQFQQGRVGRPELRVDP